jgi:hypothetical protein
MTSEKDFLHTLDELATQPISFEAKDLRFAVDDLLGSKGDALKHSFNDLEFGKIAKVRNIIRFLSRRVYDQLEKGSKIDLDNDLTSEDKDLIEKLEFKKISHYTKLIQVLEKIVRVEKYLETGEDLAELIKKRLVDKVALASLSEYYAHGLLDDPNNNQQKILDYLQDPGRRVN